MKVDVSGRHFEGTMILQAVRGYCAYSLSYRDIEALMEERFRKQKRATGGSWRMDETYSKVKGKWCDYYRALDKDGKTLDFLLCKKRDKKAAIRFFRKTIGTSGFADKINMDKSGANDYAVEWLNMVWVMMGLWTLVMIIRQNK